MTVVNKSTYTACVRFCLTLSLHRRWISGVGTSFKLSHSINTGSIDFFKQLMEAFRAGKLIKIICRSSSFKDSPLVYVELNHAWLENPSIGHRNWLVFLMAFQCSCISEKESEFLWQISCCCSNNQNTESLKMAAVCPQSVFPITSGADVCFGRRLSEINNMHPVCTQRQTQCVSALSTWCLCFNVMGPQWLFSPQLDLNQISKHVFMLSSGWLSFNSNGNIKVFSITSTHTDELITFQESNTNTVFSVQCIQR